MYRVIFTDEAERELERLDRQVQRRILQRLARLAESAEQVRQEALTDKWAGLFKLRVGDYRALYDLLREDQVILVHVVGHRREVYR